MSLSCAYCDLSIEDAQPAFEVRGDGWVKTFHSYSCPGHESVATTEVRAEFMRGVATRSAA